MQYFDNFFVQISIFYHLKMKANHVYQHLREIQKRIQNFSNQSPEFLRNETQVLTEKLEKQHTRYLPNIKLYYTKIFLMSYYLSENKFLFPNLDNLSFKVSEQEFKYIPNEFDIKFPEGADCNLLLTLQKLDEMGCFNQAFTDLFTFCLIPSLYNIFIEKNSFNMFCQLIQKLKLYYDQQKIRTPLHFLFSREIFISPLFVSFLRQSFRSIFATFSPNQPIQNYENIKAKVEKSIRANKIRMPSYIKNFLNAIQNKHNFLKESFIKPLLNLPEVFTFIDYLKLRYGKARKSFYNSLLKNVFDDGFIEKFIQIIDDDNQSDNECFFNVYCEKINITSKKLTDSIDFNAFSVIIEKLQGKSASPIDVFKNYDNSEFKIFYSNFLNEKEKEPNNEEEEIKITDINNCWVYLLKLLHDAPELPPDLEQQNEIMTEEKFFEMVKYNTVKPSESDESEELFEQFKFCFLNDNAEASTLFSSKLFFDSKMRVVMNSLINPTHYMEAIALAQLIFTHFSSCIKEDIRHMNETLYFARLEKTPKFQELPKVPTDEASVYKYSNKYINEFKKYAQILKRNKYIVIEDLNVVKKYFFKCLSFKNYLKSHPLLAKYDDIAMHVLPHLSVDPDLSLITESDYNVCDHWDLFDDIFYKIRSAFEEDGDPATKFSIINDLFDELTNFAVSYFNYHFGIDGLFPFLLGAIAKINPPHLISNCFFFGEYMVDSIKYPIWMNAVHYLAKKIEFKNYNLPDVLM